MTVYQILTTVSYGDAVSNDCLAIGKLLSANGYKTAIYAENMSKSAKARGVKKIEKLPRIRPDDIILYHLSTGTDLNVKIKSYKCRKYVIYHNTTPPDFFVKYSGKLARLCSKGLYETMELRDTFDGGFCVSDFNRQQLVSYGYKCDLKVRPILIPFEDYEKEPEPCTLKKMGGDTLTNDHEVKNIVFVGRIAPNKKQEDLISLLYAYRQLYKDSPVRLILAGNPSGMEKYMSRLGIYALKLGLKDVVFGGHLSFDKILAYYRSADAFVCMSEHEGFCVPLVEAMYFKIPIIAYDSTAIAETLGGTGILLKDKDMGKAAMCLHEVLHNKDLRQKMLAEQNERLKDFTYENVSELFMKQFREFTGL